jgi:polyhydroxyalkanoate synthesis regulator phasin
MNINDMTAALDRLYREGQAILADFAAVAEQPDAAALDALLDRLRTQMHKFFDDMHRQLQDQAQPWIAMLRARGQLADGASWAQLLMTPLSFWRPAEPAAAASSEQPQSAQGARIEAAICELATARDQYIRLLQAAADDAVERFSQALHGLGDEPCSLRELYQYWIETAEAAYEDMLGSEEFAEAAGRLTNAWSALLLIMQDDTDGMLRAVGVPSRRELSDTQAQLQELRRQQRDRERQLKREIDALRETVHALQAQLTPQASVEPPKRRRKRKSHEA